MNFFVMTITCSLLQSRSTLRHQLFCFSQLLHSNLFQQIQIQNLGSHPQTQGKIERYQRTMKNVVKLANFYCPEELISALKKFVKIYKNDGYHESLQNLTRANVYYGRGDSILK